MFGLFKAAGSLSDQTYYEGHLATFSMKIQTMLRNLISKGQSLALIRSDLDQDFLYALIVSIDDAHDQWLLPQWSQMDVSDVETAVTRIMGLLQRILSPHD